MIDTSHATSDAFHSAGFPLIEFDRRLSSRRLTGFLLGVSERFTFVHLVDEQTYVMNGYAVFPNQSVRRWRCLGPQTFLARAVKHKKLRPRLPKEVRFETWQEICSSAGSQFSLLTIHREAVVKNACWVGRFLKVSQRSVAIDYITPQASWEGPITYKLDEITLVEFGGAYESLLALLAPAPPVTQRR